MKRYIICTAAIAVLAVVSIAAQSPAGWRVRADRSANASDPDAAGNVKFAAMGTGFHAVNPRAAVYWNPSNTAAGTYTLKGTFTLMKPSDHTNYYGLVFGGSDLEGPKQNYLYFLVAQDGTWLVKRREGEAVLDVAPSTPNAAVKKLDATGKSVNALEVRVTPKGTEYLVNGTAVHTAPRTGPAARTDGLFGIRVNHQLEVMIDGFGVSK
jgi:hypothetical protein